MRILILQRKKRSFWKDFGEDQVFFKIIQYKQMKQKWKH